jgi:hypothetical protein
MGAQKKERWTEQEVLDLPRGEQDYFDRKSGAILDDSDFREKLGKALSAFANSGGGHIVLGVEDDGCVHGVSAVRKGRARTREWLEQIVPELVEYPLRDFRVHEVEPAEGSVIPSGTVLIVIDVGDSALAPHQEASRKIYYHRAGGTSVPARHFYLERLRERSSFPNPKVVRSWFDTVINPMVNKLREETIHLSQGRWSWDRVTGSLGNVSPLVGPLTTWAWPENRAQFFEEYPGLAEAADQHDRELQLVRGAVAKLFSEVRDSEALRHRYLEAVSPDSLSAMRSEFSVQFEHRKTDDQMLEGIFGDVTQAKHLARLAEYIVNREAVLPSDYNAAPIWNKYRTEFLDVLTVPPVIEISVKSERQREALVRAAESLVDMLLDIRRELARRHGEPYEV